jgi:hypothetical protein
MEGERMRLFLVIAVGCLAVFVIAGLAGGDLVPFRARRVRIWPLIQNVSAVLGIVAFVIQIVQWRRGR